MEGEMGLCFCVYVCVEIGVYVVNDKGCGNRDG